MKKILIIAALTILFTAGCEEIEIFPFSDEVEIERYLVDDDLGKIFFSVEHLKQDQRFDYPLDVNAYYVDLYDSLDREVISYFRLKDYVTGYTDAWQEFGPPFGSSQDAEVEVRDRVYGRTIRIEGVDTTIVKDLTIREIKRHGYFMKLGDDGQRFSGWILRAFSGGSPDNGTRMDMLHANNEWFPGDTFSYVHYSSRILYDSLSVILRVPKSDTLSRQGYLLLNVDQTTNRTIERVAIGEQLRAEITLSNLGLFYTVSNLVGDSMNLNNFVINSSQNYEVSIESSVTTSNSWDFFYFQEFVRNSNDTSSVPDFQSLRRRNWVIPVSIE